MRPWIVLPTYNEADNVLGVVGAVRAAVPEARVLVVDDASPDGTGVLADAVAEADPAVSVLHRPGKAGLCQAYVAGFTRALEQGATHVVEMDCDFSHDPADLPRLLRTDGDLVLGSRYVPGGAVENWHPLRRAISRGGCWYARRVLRVPVRDLTGGFKCFTAEALHAIDYRTLRAEGYAFQVETTYRAIKAGFRVIEVPILFHDRRVGNSKMSGRIVIEAALRVPAMRWRND